MMNYSDGLKHGYEDMAKLVGKELALDLPDAEKLERIGWLVARHAVDAEINNSKGEK